MSLRFQAARPGVQRRCGKIARENLHNTSATVPQRRVKKATRKSQFLLIHALPYISWQNPRARRRGQCIAKMGAGRLELPTFGFGIRCATHCAIPPFEQDRGPCASRLRARGSTALRQARARCVRMFFASDRTFLLQISWPRSRARRRKPCGRKKGAGRFELPTFGFAVRRASNCAIPLFEQDRLPFDGLVVPEQRGVRMFFGSYRPPYISWLRPWAFVFWPCV